jgi:hypothetical protein
MSESIPLADADQLLAEVAQLMRNGDHRQARTICEELHVRMPQDPDVLVWLGLIAMDEARWSDAIASFDQLLQIRVDPWSLANLGNCYCKTGRLADAEYCLRGAIELDPDIAGVHLGLAAVLHGLGKFEESISSAVRAEQLDPADYQIPMRRGCACVALGCLEEARQAFEKACNLAGKFIYPRLVEFDRAVFEAVSEQQKAIEAPLFVHDAPGDPARRRVILISCDTLYMRKHGFPFIRSFAQKGAHSGLLHVHIYDPDGTVVSEVREIAAQAGLAGFAITTEALQIPASEPQRRKAYYACGRLIHMPFLLQHYRLPILSLDVDIIVTGGLDSLFDFSVGSDVALNKRNPIDSPWLDITANILVVNPTVAAIRYMSIVGNYALRWIGREADAWMVDQTALFCVLRMMTLYAPEQVPAVAWIAQTDHPGLWHYGAANEHSLSDSRYLDFAATGPSASP